jgi:hypothetical protein
MVIPFENMPDESRIWIYQSNRKMSDAEIAEIITELEKFLNNWAAHGAPLESAYCIKYNRFIILAVNQEAQAVTGCSIDASVAFIQSLEKKYDIDLLDKMNVTFKVGEFIAHKSLVDFKKMAKEKSVTENTIEEWKENWEIPAEFSWHSRFF